MQVIDGQENCPNDVNGCVVTIGTYDGVHLGHRSVIDRTQAEAARIDAATAVITFDRHPAALLRPESAPKLLTQLDQKLEALEAMGIDYCYVVAFDEERAAEEAEHFVRTVMVDCLKARTVVVGNNFHFGRERKGSVALLTELGPSFGFEAIGLDLLTLPEMPDRPVSSTAIRGALSDGDLAAANLMLGRSYEVIGTVREGDQRGRTIGFPTANVHLPNETALPADGVYAGIYERPDGSTHPAAINLGRRPTFYDGVTDSLLEAHLIDVDADLYGEIARVRFVGRLRDEVRFDGLDALKTQLALDVQNARDLLATC